MNAGRGRARVSMSPRGLGNVKEEDEHEAKFNVQRTLNNGDRIGWLKSRRALKI